MHDAIDYRAREKAIAMKKPDGVAGLQNSREDLRKFGGLPQRFGEELDFILLSRSAGEANFFGDHLPVIKEVNGSDLGEPALEKLKGASWFNKEPNSGCSGRSA